MANNTIKVTVSKDNALTIEEFANKCKEMYGWTKAEFRDGYVFFTDDEGMELAMDTDGNVYELDAEGEAADVIETKDIRDDFDWVNCIWGEDENGKPIVVFQI